MQNSSPSMRPTLVGAACLALQPLVLNVISVPVMAYLIHRLGAAGYGQWMVATSLLSLCTVLSNLGLRGAFIRSVAADPGSATSQLAEQLGLRVLLATLAAAIAIALCHLLGYTATIQSCAIVGGVGLIFATISATLADLMQALHRIKTVALVGFISGLMLTVASVPVAFITTSPVPIVATYLTGPILSSILFFILVNKAGCRITLHFDLRRFVQLLARSRFFAAQQLLAVGSSQAESLILPQLVGISQFGFFTAGSLLANRLTAIPDGLCTAAYPAMSRACANGGTGAGRSVMFRYMWVAATLGIAMAVALSLMARPITWMLFPHQSQLFGTVLRITAWSLPFVAVESVMGYALNAAGKDAAQSGVSVPAAFVSLAISISLVTTLGVIGASVSMLLRPAVRAAFLAPLFHRTFHADPQMGDQVILTICPEAMSARKAG